MYKFKYTEKFACPPKDAFDATTTGFEGLAKYVPNVTKIEELSRENIDGGKFRLLLKFFGDGAIPLVARAIIKPEMLRWKEEMICDPAAKSIDWKIEAAHFSEHIHCGGTTVYKEAAGNCEMQLEGYFSVTIKHLPGLPDPLVEKAAAALEPFIGKFISPNLAKFYQAVKKNMHAQGMKA